MINKLVDKIKKTNAPIVVGLDPMLSYVPEHITKKAFDELGETPAGAAEAIWQYNKAIVDATYDLIPAVKCTFPRCPVAYAADVEPISPRFTSPITTRSFS